MIMIDEKVSNTKLMTVVQPKNAVTVSIEFIFVGSGEYYRDGSKLPNERQCIDPQIEFIRDTDNVIANRNISTLTAIAEMTLLDSKTVGKRICHLRARIQVCAAYAVYLVNVIQPYA